MTRLREFVEPAVAVEQERAVLCIDPWVGGDEAQVADRVDVGGARAAGLAWQQVAADRVERRPRVVVVCLRDAVEAEQQRDRLQKEADAYSNTVLAGARGAAAQILEEAEGYRAQVVNQAEGEASRFSAVLAEYAKAPEVTRKRLYLETMEMVLGRVDKVILDENQNAQGVVPYLPLNELGRRKPAAPEAAGGGN